MNTVILVAVGVVALIGIIKTIYDLTKFYRRK